MREPSPHQPQEAVLRLTFGNGRERLSAAVVDDRVRQLASPGTIDRIDEVFRVRGVFNEAGEGDRTLSKEIGHGGVAGRQGIRGDGTTSTSLPAIVRAAASSAGISSRQGTHQVAQKLTTSARPRCGATTLARYSSGVTETTSAEAAPGADRPSRIRASAAAANFKGA